MGQLKKGNATQRSRPYRHWRRQGVHSSPGTRLRRRPLSGRPIWRDPRFLHVAAPERIISTPSNKRPDREEIKRLLARTSVIRNGCDLDLLVFFYRHPRTLLTSEQIAAFVGRDMKLVAEALDAFIAAGLVERLHNPTHAARMYLLVVHGPEGKGLKTLLELASTRQGRHEILEALNSGRWGNEEQTRRLQLIKSASA